MSEQTIFASVSDPETEIWKPVPEYPDYDVSSRGRVRRREAVGRWAAGHVLRPGPARSGHLHVILTGPNRRARKEFVHRLVAKAFVGPSPFDGAMVLHHDDCPTNNRPGNLSTAETNPATGRRKTRPVAGGRAPWRARSPDSWRVPWRFGPRGQSLSV